MNVLVREVVRPPWAFMLPRPSMDGLLRRRGDGLIRLVHVDGAPVVVAVAQPAPERVVFAARAPSEAAAEAGIAQLRFAVGVDDELEPFHARFRDDPVIGAAVRAQPGLRVRRTPEPFQTLVAAITEQLIEFDRAVRIQRRMIRALGPRCARTGLRDAPSAAVVAAQSPARLESFGLAGKRAIALRRAAIEVAAGREDFRADGFPRLRAIREIGQWTLDVLALHGLGRLDVIPAGDLGYLQLVARHRGRPHGLADEAEVRAFFSAYAPWAGLAGEYLRLSRPPSPRRTPRAETRSSAGTLPTAVA